MKIEDEIQQPVFRNEKQKAIININYTHGWIMNSLRNILASEDVTSQQYNILRILRGSSAPLSTCELRERMIDRNSDTSRIVSRLVKKGLVKKAPSHEDSRLIDVVISEDGLAVLKRLDAHNKELDGVLDNISEQEAAILNLILDKVRG